MLKKMIALLSSLSLVATSALTVVSCNTEKDSADHLFQQKMNVVNAVKEIVEDGISFHDDFLLNYDLYKNGTNEQREFFRGSIWGELLNGYIGVFNKLLVKLIYKKLLTKIPNLKEQFPDFTLKVYFEYPDGVSAKQKDKIVQNEEVNLSYRVGLTFSAYDSIEKLQLENSFDELVSNEDYPALLGKSEFIVDGNNSSILKGKDPIFKFQQKGFINNHKQWLDYYYDLYNNSGWKVFETDSNDRTSFSMFQYFSLWEVDKEEYSLPNYLVNVLNSNNNDFINIQEKIKSYFEDYLSVPSFYPFRAYNKLNQLDNVEIQNLKFVNAYTGQQILNDPKLKRALYYSFGKRTLDGVLIYDIDLIFKFGWNQTNTYKERIYVYSFLHRF